MEIFGYKISRKKDSEPKEREDSDELAEMRRFKAEQKREDMRMEREERRMELEEKKLMHAERMREYKEKLYGIEEDDEDDEDSTVTKAVLALIANAGVSKASPPVSPASVYTPPPADSTLSTPEAGGVTITDEQFEEYWNSLNIFKRKIAKSMSKEQLSNLLKTQVKGITNESIDRAYTILQTK